MINTADYDALWIYLLGHCSTAECSWQTKQSSQSYLFTYEKLHKMKTQLQQEILKSLLNQLALYLCLPGRNISGASLTDLILPNASKTLQTYKMPVLVTDFVQDCCQNITR